MLRVNRFMLRLSASVAITSLGILTVSSGVASAGIWSSSAAWGSQAASFAPDYGNTSMYEYVGTDGSTVVSPKTRFRFTQDAINGIRNYYYNEGEYYTFDISLTDAYNKTLSAYTGSYYCSLPNCKFDSDDDPELAGGNGYRDETEGVSLSPTQIVADTDYRFESYFRVYSKTPITFEFGSQTSYKVFGTDEYDTSEISPHLQRRYPWY